MALRASRILLIVGAAAVFFAAGVLIEEAIDGDDTSTLAIAVAIGGGLVGALGAYLSSRDKAR